MSEVLPPTLHLLFSSVNRQLLALSNSLMLLSRVQGQCKSMCWECQFKSSMIKECHVVWAHALLFCSERWEKILNLNSVHTDNSQYDDECRYVCQFRSIPRFQKSPNYCVMIRKVNVRRRLVYLWTEHVPFLCEVVSFRLN